MEEALNQYLQSNKGVEEAYKRLKIQYGKVLLAFIELYLTTVKEDKNKQYILDFCDKLNQLSVTY